MDSKKNINELKKNTEKILEQLAIEPTPTTSINIALQQLDIFSLMNKFKIPYRVYGMAVPVLAFENKKKVATFDIDCSILLSEQFFSRISALTQTLNVIMCSKKFTRPADFAFRTGWYRRHKGEKYYSKSKILRELNLLVMDKGILIDLHFCLSSKWKKLELEADTTSSNFLYDSSKKIIYRGDIKARLGLGLTPPDKKAMLQFENGETTLLSTLFKQSWFKVFRRIVKSLMVIKYPPCVINEDSRRRLPIQFQIGYELAMKLEKIPEDIIWIILRFIGNQTNNLYKTKTFDHVFSND